MAGGELRLGTVSMYMGATIHYKSELSSEIFRFTWEHIEMRDSSQPLHNQRLHPEFSANFQGNFGLEGFPASGEKSHIKGSNCGPISYP
jgi:hypothetical protein